MEAYVVTADAVMLTVGKKANGRPRVQRLMHGTTINAEPTDERIVDLLAIKSIVLSDRPAAKRGAHVTVKMVAKGMLPEGEPLNVMNGIEPLPADAPAPGAIPLVSVDA